MVNQTALTSLMKPTAPRRLTQRTRRRRSTLTARIAKTGCLNAPTASAFLIGGNAIRLMTAAMAVTSVDVERMTTRRLLNRLKLQSHRNVVNMSSDATLAFVFRGVTFAMDLEIAEEVRAELREMISLIARLISGEDEENCPANRASCGQNEFRCRSDGNCMPMSKYCDGVLNCADGSDEQNCKGLRNITIPDIPNNDCHKKPGLFFCDDTCFPLMKVCDGASDCLNGQDEMDCDKKQRIYQVVSIGVNERTLNSTSFLIYWWIAVPQNMTFEYLPSIYVKNAWKNNTEWIESTEYRFNNLEPFTLYNVTVYVRVKGTRREFVPYLYYEVATAEGGKCYWRLTCIAEPI